MNGKATSFLGPLPGPGKDVDGKDTYNFPFTTLPLATVRLDHVIGQRQTRIDSNVSNGRNCHYINTSFDNSLT